MVFVCDGLQDEDLGPGSDCDYVSDRVEQCFDDVIGSWAVGGSVRISKVYNNSCAEFVAGVGLLLS